VIDMTFRPFCVFGNFPARLLKNPRPWEVLSVRTLRIEALRVVAGSVSRLGANRVPGKAGEVAGLSATTSRAVHPEAIAV
jgi:hypothetical protein